MNSVFILGILGIVILVTLVFIFRKRKGILLVLFLLIVVGGWFAYKEYSRTNSDLANVKADLKVTAGVLIRDYEKEDSLANEKYLGKVLEVTGTVKEVTKDESGFYTIALGEQGNPSSVRCSMDSSHRADAANVSAGSSATIRGACTGFNKDELGLGSDVILNRAVIVSKK
jgi:hypothetical protein